MGNVSLKGSPVTTSGVIPKIGEKAKDFSLVKTDLSKVSLADFSGSRLVLNIFPSIDTGTCAASVRQFNKLAADLSNTKVLCIARDLPFAMKRFCGAEGIENVVSLSDFATGQFGRDYGLEITSGPLSNLHSRVVIVLDENGVVKHAEQVADIVNEPDYQAALNSLK
ncbi:MAG: thiol peroxidase [Crocinitomicaceae bacterium]|nr:thiol peroxidase [Crocinitomicaceae bacterium]